MTPLRVEGGASASDPHGHKVAVLGGVRRPAELPRLGAQHHDLVGGGRELGELLATERRDFALGRGSEVVSAGPNAPWAEGVRRRGIQNKSLASWRPSSSTEMPAPHRWKSMVVMSRCRRDRSSGLPEACS